jgi:stage V sporulation protein SpoVS
MMKNKVAFGAVAGFLVGAAAAVAGAITADKISREMKENIAERDFVSPDGDRVVTLSYGSSKSAGSIVTVEPSSGSIFT